jgi:hypothetical protein
LNHPASVFSVTAHNTAPDSENKIHDDHVAAAYGFRGGLVPGVTVYGYMVPPILERFGRLWLERGSIALRLLAPCYEGETVATRCDGSVAIAQHANGSLYASGTVTLDHNRDGSSAAISSAPLPSMDRRPLASPESIVPGKPLGSICQTLDVAEETAIPERLLRMANEILVQNFRMSPWIHAGSEIRHHRLAACGGEIKVCGVIEECFERKGRRFAVAKLAIYANDGARESGLVATVRHTFIYNLQQH